MEETLAGLVRQLGGELLGDGRTRVCRVASMAGADAESLVFVADAKYLPALAQTRAAAVILAPEHRDATTLPRILTPDPYLYFARVAALFVQAARPAAGIHPSAVVAPEAVVDPTAHVGANAVIESSAVIHAQAIIGANCVVGAGSSVGRGTRLYANVTVYPGCQIGEDCILHSGAVIGADGFGFAPHAGVWEKIPQTGGVKIGNRVEVGACTTIDRGTLDDTVIEDGVKLDNLIQIAHNVHIGAHTAIAACTGIAGSAKIGRHCTIGGAAMIFGHIEIAEGTRISTNTLITKSITRAGTYTSVMPFSEHEHWQKNAAHLRHLDRLVQRVKALEHKLAELENKT